MDRAKLAALLKETESDFAFEVVKACKAANALLKAHGMTWAELLAEPLPKPEKAAIEEPEQPEQPEPPKTPRNCFSKEEADLWRRRIEDLRARGPAKYGNFFASIHSSLTVYGSLTTKQQTAIMKFNPGF